MATAAISVERRQIDLSRVLITGAVIALLDGVFAEVFYVPMYHRTTTLRLWQGLAVSLLGKDAMDGGVPTALFGIGIHICIAYLWSTVFAVAYSQVAALRRAVSTTAGALVVGVLYGPFIWLMMQYVLVPLTRITKGPITWTFWVQLVWHAVALGPPIVFLIRRPSVSRG